MPYDQANGRLYADDTRGVGLASVALCLKERLTDTATLCCSEKINPYSLIGPRFYRDTKGSMPGRAPGKYGTPPVLGDTTDSLPDQNAVPSAKAGEVTGEFACSSLTTATAEYTFRSAATFMYEKRRFGFFVPYVQDPQDIFALRDLYWKRYGPKDGNWVTTNGKRKLTDSWCVLDHFDGYLHNAEPVEVMSSATLKYGEKPACVPAMATGAWKITDVLGPEGKNNPGGAVSIQAVLGATSLTYGATLFKKSGSKFTMLASGIGGTVGAETAGGYGKLSAVTFPIEAFTTNGEYLLIPWVCDTAVTVDSSGKFVNIPKDVKFYCCNYDASHQAYAREQVIIKELKPGTSARIYKGNVSTRPDLWYVIFSVQNEFDLNPDRYPLELYCPPKSIDITYRNPLNGNAQFTEEECSYFKEDGFPTDGTSPIIQWDPGSIIFPGVYAQKTFTIGFNCPISGGTVTGVKMHFQSIDKNHSQTIYRNLTIDVLSTEGTDPTNPEA